jgi:hypothetical protein
MSLVTWGGKLLLTGGKLTLGPAAAECCCEEPAGCCMPPGINLFDTFPSANVLRATVIWSPDGCVPLNETCLLTNTSPLIYTGQMGDGVGHCGILSFSCEAGSPSTWMLSAQTCPASNPIPLVSGMCDPWYWDFTFTVSAFDLSCNCGMTGGSFTIRIEMEP